MGKKIDKRIEGGGGGQAFFATSGGKRKEGLAAAIQEIKSLF
jgi:alanyl-tRNA synthetase